MCNQNKAVATTTTTNRSKFKCAGTPQRYIKQPRLKRRVTLRSTMKLVMQKGYKKLYYKLTENKPELLPMFQVIQTHNNVVKFSHNNYL